MDAGAPIDKISEEHAIAATSWGKYLESHAYRLYASAQHPSIESARELLKHFQKGDIQDEFSARDIYRKEWSKLASPEEVKESLEILIDYGWVKLGKSSSPKKQVYSLHPSLGKLI